MSGMFTFYVHVGTQTQYFMVHRHPFMARSPVFGNMMNGRFGHDLNNIDTYTFTGLIQYIYTSSYVVPKIDSVMPKLSYGDRCPATIEAFFSGKRLSLAANRGVSEGKEPLAYAFMDTYTDSYHNKARFENLAFPTIQNPDMTSTFNRHFQMYSAGRYFQVVGLGKLALYRLADALAHFEDTWDGLVAVAGLCKTIYTHTKAGDPIREMVAMYAACRYETYRLHPSMKGVFTSILAFATDVERQVDAFKNYKPPERHSLDHCIRCIEEQFNVSITYEEI